MRSCFPRRLQWGYESHQSGSAEWTAQTASCWAEAVDVGGAPTVGEQEALPWRRVRNLSSSNCNRQQPFLQKLAVAHRGCGPRLVCHFCSFVSKRFQIRNGCVTDHDIDTPWVHGWYEIFFPLNTAACSEIFASTLRGVMLSSPEFPEQCTAASKVSGSSTHPGWWGLPGGARTPAHASPYKRSLCLNTMMPTFFIRAVPALPMQKTVSFSFKTENNAATKQRNPAIILSRQVLWRWDKVLLTKCSFTDISSAIESEDQLLSLAFHSARCCF